MSRTELLAALQEAISKIDDNGLDLLLRTAHTLGESRTTKQRELTQIQPKREGR